MPKYRGEDDLEAFMKWLQAFLTFLDIHQLVGRDNDYNRILTIGAALEGRALGWYQLTLRGPTSGASLSFMETVIRISDEFLTPAAATKAQQTLEKVQYSPTLGIRTYVRELQALANHVFMPIDEYTLRRQLVAAIPQSICHWLINYKDLSTSTSTVVEWVNAVERRERELLEREAYNASVPAAKKPATGPSRSQSTYTANNARTFNKPTARVAITARASGTNATRPQAVGNTTPKTSTTPRPQDHGTSTGQRVPERQRVPLADITCHACGNKGHYKGSRECPKTPSSARLHAMGAESDAEGHAPAEVEETSEDLFDGAEYIGDDDFGPTEDTPEFDDEGTGVIIASIHVNEDEDDDEVVYAAPMNAAKPSSSNDDAKVATELIKSIKEDYEVRGSGIKPRPIGKTDKQVKANSTKDWASNSNVKPIKPIIGGKTPINRQGLPSLVKVNGVEAYTCWDTGSELDAISPDFTRATGIKPRPKEEALRIRLGTKGTSASTSYEVTPTLDFGKTKLKHDVDVVNLDRWDLLLGNPFCNKHGVVLDFEKRTIRFGDMIIDALTREEEAAVRKGEGKPRLHAVSN